LTLAVPTQTQLRLAADVRHAPRWQAAGVVSAPRGGRAMLEGLSPELTAALEVPARYATLTEYARATGRPALEVLGDLERHITAGHVAVESHDGELVLHTAPFGRPGVEPAPQAPPNLWEVLRISGSVAEAARLWSVLRSLEHAGWVLELNPARARFGQGRFGPWSPFGVKVGVRAAPVLIDVDLSEMAERSGPLSAFDHAGAATVAVLCAHGHLDDAVTAVRTWAAAQPLRPGLSVLVLEAPRYNPTLVRTDDTSVTPVTVQLDQVGRALAAAHPS
jgi:hypothetical protein